MKNTEYTCRQCKHEFLGRCVSPYQYSKDVSVQDEICLLFVDARSPDKVTFDTLGQLENYLR